MGKKRKMDEETIPTEEITGQTFDLEAGYYVVRPDQTLLKGRDGFPKRFRGKQSAEDAACCITDRGEGCALLFVLANFAWGE